MAQSQSLNFDLAAHNESYQFLKRVNYLMFHRYLIFQKKPILMKEGKEGRKFSQVLRLILYVCLTSNFSRETRIIPEW